MMSPEANLLFGKPLASGVTAFLIDRFYFRQTQVMPNVAFAASVAIGILAADQIAKRTGHSTVSKSLEARALEIGLSTALALGTDSYVFREARSDFEMPQRVAAVIGSEIIGEYVADSFLGM